MITAGIDMGAKSVKVVILADGQVKARTRVLAGLDSRNSAHNAVDFALGEAGFTRSALACVTATGVGRKEADMADRTMTEVTAVAMGASYVHPAVRTVIDVGAEEGRGIRVDPEGRVVDFAVNERCAAGTGAFTEAVARALDVSIEELGPLGLRSEKAVPMNTQCVVFAESEVVSLIHANAARADIARAVHEALAGRVVSLVRKVGVARDVLLVGGVALNVGFVDSVVRCLEMEVVVPHHPEFMGALGAALDAAGPAAR